MVRVENVTIQIDATAIKNQAQDAAQTEARRSQTPLRDGTLRKRPACNHRIDDFGCAYLESDIPAATKGDDPSPGCPITPGMALGRLLCEQPDGTWIPDPNRTIQIFNHSTSIIPATGADDCRVPYPVHRDFKSKKWKLVGGASGQIEELKECICELAEIAKDLAQAAGAPQAVEDRIDALIAEKCEEPTETTSCPTCTGSNQLMPQPVPVEISGVVGLPDLTNVYGATVAQQILDFVNQTHEFTIASNPADPNVCRGEIVELLDGTFGGPIVQLVLRHAGAGVWSIQASFPSAAGFTNSFSSSNTPHLDCFATATLDQASGGGTFYDLSGASAVVNP